MYCVFRAGSFARTLKPYQRSYENPVAVRAGDAVTVDTLRSKDTDVLGWLWVRGPDGREGWAPEAWLTGHGDQRVIRRDFNAIELNVVPGETVELLVGESGFVWCRKPDGQEGWLWQAVLALLPGVRLSSDEHPSHESRQAASPPPPAVLA
jgi:hypothetical protein